MPTNGFTNIARKYLDTRNKGLWAGFFLADPKSFEDAVQWLADVLAELHRPDFDL